MRLSPLLYAGLTLASCAAQAEASTCPSALGPAAQASCLISWGAGEGARALLTLKEQAQSTFGKDTPTRARLPNGSLAPATLSAKALRGRSLASGQVLELSCEKRAAPLPSRYGYASCELRFPKRAPNPHARDYPALIGEQPSWRLGASESGELEPGLIALDPARPLSELLIQKPAAAARQAKAP